MEEELAKFFELARNQSISENDLIDLIGRKGFVKSGDDYLKARSAGLSIAQANFACILKEEFLDRGPESLLALLGKAKFTVGQKSKKRNKKVCKDEPKLMKKWKNCKREKNKGKVEDFVN